MYNAGNTERVSIHAPNEGSDFAVDLVGCQLRVSIHAPNEGSDIEVVKKSAEADVSIHAPNEGSDSLPCPLLFAWRVFQSTLPMKGATP